MNQKTVPGELELSEKEIEEAMAEMEGFIDITPADFSKIYHKAYHLAYEKALKKTPENKQVKEPVTTQSGILKFLRPLSEPAPRVAAKDIIWSWLAALSGIGLVSWLNSFIMAPRDMLLVIGSFGASAVLIYGAIKSPLAQPRNLIGGHFVSAFAGVASWQMFSSEPWFAGAFAVATAIAFMHLTRTVHPPGGATALIAVIGGEKIHHLGYSYAFLPVLSGAVIMLAVAMLFNNIVKWRKYPEFWL